MGSPQDPRKRAKQKARRAKKNAEYDAKKAAEAAKTTDRKGAAPVAGASR
jgi:hypothetical protein